MPLVDNVRILDLNIQKWHFYYLMWQGLLWLSQRSWEICSNFKIIFSLFSYSNYTWVIALHGVCSKIWGWSRLIELNAKRFINCSLHSKSFDLLSLATEFHLVSIGTTSVRYWENWQLVFHYIYDSLSSKNSLIWISESLNLDISKSINLGLSVLVHFLNFLPNLIFLTS